MSVQASQKYSSRNPLSCITENCPSQIYKLCGTYSFSNIYNEHCKTDSSYIFCYKKRICNYNKNTNYYYILFKKSALIITFQKVGPTEDFFFNILIKITFFTTIFFSTVKQIYTWKRKKAFMQKITSRDHYRSIESHFLLELWSVFVTDV